jgi:hypothetical protein
MMTRITEGVDTQFASPAIVGTTYDEWSARQTNSDLSYLPTRSHFFSTLPTSRTVSQLVPAREWHQEAATMQDADRLRAHRW